MSITPDSSWQQLYDLMGRRAQSYILKKNYRVNPWFLEEAKRRGFLKDDNRTHLSLATQTWCLKSENPLLAWAGIAQSVKVSEAGVQARLHTGGGGRYLWVVNPERRGRTVEVTVPGPVSAGREIWQKGAAAVRVSGNRVTVEVQDRNVAVVELS